MKIIKNKIFKEKRKGPDFQTRLIGVFMPLGWGLIILAFIFFDMAHPQTSTFLDRLYGLEVRRVWDEAQLKWTLWLSYGGLLVSILGLFINANHLKRKKDEVHYSLIILGFISLFSALYLIIVF